MNGTAVAPARVTLIDGRSGAGKSSLAAQLAERAGALVVHMDDLYEGWEGLAAGSRYAVERILAPLRRGEPAIWRRWDWAAGSRAEEHRIEPGIPIVLEGCGAISRASRLLADHAIWLCAPEALRRERARDRDGCIAWWEAWRAQEDAFYAAEGSPGLADERIMTAGPVLPAVAAGASVAGPRGSAGTGSSAEWRG